MTCKTHPDAPHGFDRNASHSQDRYVCECESWEPPEQTKPMGVSCPRCGKTGLQPDSIHTCTPLALVLADYWGTRAKELQVWVDENDYVEFGYRPEGLKKEQADQRETADELRRLHQHELALKEWLDKTEWVQETHEAYELGMHRADALKRRIDRLVNTLAETHGAYQAKLLHDEALLRQALYVIEAWERGCDKSDYWRDRDDAIAALRTRLEGKT